MLAVWEDHTAMSEGEGRLKRNIPRKRADLKNCLKRVVEEEAEQTKRPRENANGEETSEVFVVRSRMNR